MACATCELVQRVEGLGPGAVARCARCRTVVAREKSRSGSRTAAFSLAALFLYIPANTYPILRMDYMGRYSESTVWDGVVTLYRDGMWFVATVVFLASILVPLLKLLGLFVLVGMAGSRRRRLERTWIYRIIRWIGPWAMLDVFLLSVLVALVKLGEFATVVAGPGIIAFSAVVVLTILASSSFDPRLIWKEQPA